MAARQKNRPVEMANSNPQPQAQSQPQTPPKENPQGVVYGCVTHVPLWIDFPAYVTPIYLGAAQGPGRMNLRDLAPEWEPHHPVLGGAAGLFALKNLVLQRPGTTRVGVGQYRKFVTRQRIGVASATYQVMDILSKQQLLEQDLFDLMLPGDASFLTGQPGSFTLNGVSFDYLYQYKDVHHVEDFLRFTAAAVELGALDKQDVHPFFSEKIFFPGGIELGYYPVDFWVKGVTALEAVARFCIQRYPIPRQGAQARSWAFCIERLGSFMLLKHLRSQGLQSPFGYLNLITEELGMDYVPGV